METRKLILLVDDNPDDQMLTLEALKESPFDFDILIVNDGIEALDFLNKTGKYANTDHTVLPQLILLDLKLPKLHGLEVLQKIRNKYSTQLLPVVILTSSRELQDLTAAYRLGANSYICKPIDFDEFTQIIQQVGQYWLNINQMPFQK